MAATTTFNMDVFPRLLKKIFSEHVWSYSNLPLQWKYRGSDKFKEYVEKLSADGPSQRISRSVDGYVPLSIGECVEIFGISFKVCEKFYNLDSENLEYNLRLSTI
jgi:hypothetical protein